MFDVGFIVGKFMPLHKGHELLINTALKECDKVYILSYNSEDFGFNYAVRRTWLETLFPSVNVNVVSYNLEHINVECDRLLCASYLYNMLLDNHSIGDDSSIAVYSSEEYGEPLSEVIRDTTKLNVTNRVVDLGRIQVPISGTVLRANPDSKFLSPFVYNKRAVILGGESSGKTTLVKELSNYHYVVYEYGREWWDKSEKTMADLMHIAEVQVGRENELALQRIISPNVIICDTSPLTTAFYAGELFGYVPKRLQHLAKRGYNHYILLKRHFDHVQDGSRRDQAFSDKAFEFYRNYLEVNKLPYLLIDSGSPEENAMKVIKYTKKEIT